MPELPAAAAAAAVAAAAAAASVKFVMVRIGNSERIK